MKKKEMRALKVIMIAGLVGALVPIGKLWGVGTLPAMVAAACFSLMVAAGVYLAVIAEK